MQTKERIIAVLEEMHVFFINHKVGGWENLTKHSITNLQEGKDPGLVLENFNGAGMGSLIDLWISPKNGNILKKSEAETNRELQILIEKILVIKNSLEKKNSR